MGTLVLFASVSGASAINFTENISPPIGFKWRILLAYTKITTTAVSGARSAYINLHYGVNVFTLGGVGGSTLVGNDFSTVSSSQKIDLAPYSGADAPNAYLYPNFDISSSDEITFICGILANDEAAFYLLVEEIPDGA